MPQRTDRTYAEVSLSALKNNIRFYKNACDKKIIAVCKAFSYGHGMISPFLEEYVDAFAVATAEEGVRLRLAGVEKPVLVLGYVSDDDLLRAAFHRLTLSLFDVQTALRQEEILRQNDVTLSAHLKINTGMNRLGLSPSDLTRFPQLPHVRITGIFSHYAVSRKEDEVFFRRQTDVFLSAISVARARGFSFDFIHLSSSGNALYSPVGNAVRIGYGMYGYGDPILTPALSWYARVVQTHTLSPGETVGYNRTFRTSRPTLLAVLSVGYGDGFPRERSNVGHVLYNGQRLPVVGRVCMDMLFVDGTGTDIRPGKYVTLLGKNSTDVFTPNDLGFGYETLCRISSRVPRYIVD